MSQPFNFIKTGNAKLIRHNMFNAIQQQIDIPDGDIQHGQMLYQDLCAGCHAYIVTGPDLWNIYGARTGIQRQFVNYSQKTKALRSQKWSKERLFTMLQCPELVFGMESAMLFDGIVDPYDRACIVEYIHFLRFTNPLPQKAHNYMKY